MESKLMRCLACNTPLSTYDSCVRDLVTGEYLDLCSTCRKSVKDLYHFYNRQDPLSDEEIVEEMTNEFRNQ